MRKITALAAAVLTTLAASQANATVFIVDNFDGPDQFVFDSTVGGGLASNGPVGPVNPPANTLSRTVTHELLGGGANTTGNRSNATVGSQTFPAGALEVFNASGSDSQVSVAWTIPAGFIPSSAVGPASLFFALFFADSTTSFNLFYNGVLFSTQNFPSYDGTTDPDGPGPLLPLGPSPINFNLTAAQQDAIVAGVGTQELKLVIDGPAAWTVSLDAFGFEIPEPASLALVGAALMGAGLASRRRKAS